MKTFIRSDGEEFVEVEPGLFSIKSDLEEFPNNIHHKWSYIQLETEGFALKERILIDRLKFKNDPEITYYLPSGSPGYKIIVSHTPYEGVTAQLMKE